MTRWLRRLIDRLLFGPAPAPVRRIPTSVLDRAFPERGRS